MQINRLFEIIYLLLQKETITAKELADKFEVSTRTIYRDVETLSSAGIPIYMSKGKGGGISLLSDFVLDKTVLTNEEKENILSSLRAVGEVNLSEQNLALQKFSSLFGESYVDWIEVDFSSWYNFGDETIIFQTLKKAICKRKTVSFQYSNVKGEQSSRQVEPLKLCFKGGAWYLYGYCKAKLDYRFFKLRRMKNLEMTNDMVEHKAPKRILKSDNHFKEEYLHLKLHLSSKMAYRVYEEFEHYDKQPDGSFIVEIDYPKNKWLFYYILSFGSHCEVLEPIRIRDEVKLQLQQILKHYE
ncbi:helix-turn-helix transcriptional regulator [Sedimentibacter sp. MB31-C6]|uniref:helix-turn-helix transcriptional regulator n=1 Tax=Sedimentibacter sp. MB31-C6 TaxID=3109366 RepID=UPI002DDCDCDE|nr:YafY family protein [Sedimentibacter sp. MB36-C1]WSI03232.1 YafY family protein [Sedimentibacter sp. MB36-C1]